MHLFFVNIANVCHSEMIMINKNNNNNIIIVQDGVLVITDH